MKKDLPFEIPCVVNGKHVRVLQTVCCIRLSFNSQIKTGNLAKQPIPADHASHLCEYHQADPDTVSAAIDGALSGKAAWEALPWNDRAAIFLKAADLVSGKYRYQLLAATMLGQGKNAWQAEIDAAAEVRTKYHAIVSPDVVHIMQLTDGGFLPFRRQIR